MFSHVQTCSDMFSHGDVRVACRIAQRFQRTDPRLSATAELLLKTLSTKLKTSLNAYDHNSNASLVKYSVSLSLRLQCRPVNFLHIQVYSTVRTQFGRCADDFMRALWSRDWGSETVDARRRPAVRTWRRS